ncbi:MAG: heat-inducible transcriptional repressor HrcA [Bifidobacteriaceae bacterium]|nr:heat-inducible transcriptional repressor HrcA [Bifidobacteriaceae bacterium]
MSQDRRMLVLRAVVEDYIRTQEPVGSGAVTKDFPLHVSSATVRNDMAALEEEGYLVQPHTSAGRVPTEKGYRFFVDRLVKVVPLSPAQQRGIESFFTQSVSLEDTLRRAARLLAQITGQVAVVASPSIVKSHLRRFEMVPLASNTYLLVIISDTGRVEQRTLATSMPPKQSELDHLIRTVNARNDGQPISLLSRRLRDLAQNEDFSSVRGFLETIASAVSGMRDEERSDSLYMSGASQLTRHGAAALSTLAPLLDALEEQVVLMRLMGSVSRSAQSSGVNGVGVAIGSETHTQGLLNASVVTSGYGSAAVDGGTQGGENSTDSAYSDAQDDPERSEAVSPLAFVGSIGPTHMNYPTTIAAVKAVAEYLSAFINKQDS